MQDIKQYTREDFLESTEPYEFVYSFAENKFTQERIMLAVAAIAQSQGIRNFKKLFMEYVSLQKKNSCLIQSDSVTQFEGQAIELNCGDWAADECGVTMMGMFGEVKACSHPIMPVERLVNIDTGIEKLKIAYRKGRNWRTVIFDKKTIASNNSILDMANYGVSVTSETSKHLVKYLQDLENLNYDIIPEKNSVSRLGWIEGEGFSPYCGHLEFDGDLNFKKSFESVQQKGDLEKWVETAMSGRSKSITTKIILAASFSSVLVKPLGCLPFFVHLWGGTEVGKTVGLMLAASVWANPEVGKFIQSFNSTVVGRERMASFFNNMPLLLDELQVIKDKKTFDHDIYTLCEGAGKVRGNKTGGTDQTPTWGNCILSNGEMPITNSSSGGGAVNRIIEIECKEALFNEPQEVCNILRKNHGIAGKMFIEYLQQDGIMDKVNLIYKDFYSALSENDTTQKQAISAALILTADKIITEMFFHDSALTVNDIKGYLQTKKDVSAHARAYEYLCNWIAENINNFKESDSGQAYGKIEGEYAFINKKIFEEACNGAGFNSTALLSYLKENKLILHGKERIPVGRKINRIQTWCIALRLPDEAEMIFNEETKP